MIENLKHDLKLLNDNKSQKEQIVIEIKRKQRECLHEIGKSIFIFLFHFIVLKVKKNK